MPHPLVPSEMLARPLDFSALLHSRSGESRLSATHPQQGAPRSRTRRVVAFIAAKDPSLTDRSPRDPA
jgi:hypothetical protein